MVTVENYVTVVREGMVMLRENTNENLIIVRDQGAG